MSKKDTNEHIVEEKDTVENEVNDIAENTEEQTQEQEEDTTEESELSPLELKEIELRELNDKYIRLFSEFDNFRKRTAKEKIELTMTAGANIIKELLPILDDFDRANENNKNVDDIEVIKEGFNLIDHKLNHVLKAKGLKATDALGETFDVNKHEALTQIPAPSEDLVGKVVDVIEKGYLLNDKVLRFAKVVVGQ